MADDAKTELRTADILDILKVLPHRYPFLMVDRIVDINGNESGVGIKNVTFNEPHFMGHFPGQPVMPGVLIVEGMAQTAGAMCVLAASGSAVPRVVYFMTIDKCKFRKPVVPGDTVEYHLTKLKNRGSMWWYQGVAMVDGQKVAEAELSAMLVIDKD
ncbi:MAG TPA: 3-hydroxyacyl-ACP dehydratase FabZ [Kaistiaceae bacterium]|nr:3-hydroxyacyl-ACP dehydratase FabZ [Kaistiaceae bacterium]